ncbi:hypothetical protein B4129_3138 [Bacillus safensis]|nr:hypothetical protein B4129_3138 [Bacillus safensis]
MSFFIPSWWFLFLLEYHLEKNFPNEQYVRPAKDEICSTRWQMSAQSVYMSQMF